MPKCVHVVTRPSGGGGRAAERLFRGLLDLEPSTLLYSRGHAESAASDRVFAPSPALPAKLNRWWQRRRIHPLLHKSRELLGDEAIWTVDDWIIDGQDVIDQIPEGDVIHLHSLYNFIDLRLFFGSRGRRQPVVWTLHDMVAFTGGCIYSDGCTRFAESCGRCPILGSEKDRDWSRQSWLRKESAYRGIDSDRFRIVTPSRWMKQQVEKSSLLGRFRVDVIPYGIDLEVYRPLDTRNIRELLQLPGDACVILFVTQYNLSNRRKGMQQLIEAFGQMTSGSPIHLLTVGKGAPPRDLPFPNTHLGEIDDERIQALIYNSADIVAVPSLEDNLPLVIQEAMACGRPVAAFDTGGIPEMITDGVHGRLAPTGDAKALGEALQALADSPEDRETMGANARKKALAEYPLEQQAQACLNIYREMLESAPATS